MDRDKKGDVEDVFVDQLSYGKRKQYHQNWETRKKHRMQVNQKVHIDEDYRTYGPICVENELFFRLVI